MNSMFNMLN